MVWAKIEQEEEYLERDRISTSGTIYKDHLIILQDGSFGGELRCLNLRIYLVFLLFIIFLDTRDTWSNFFIEAIQRESTASSCQNRLLVFNDMLLVCAEADNRLIVGCMDLESKKIFAVCF